MLAPQELGSCLVSVVFSGNKEILIASLLSELILEYEVPVPEE